MKKIICSIELFDLYQSIQIADTETGEIEEVAKVPRDDLEETIAAVSYKYQVPQVILSGHPFGEQIAQDIIEYSKTTYGKDIELKVEVIK
jgi:hypothetical protein